MVATVGVKSEMRTSKSVSNRRGGDFTKGSKTRFYIALARFPRLSAALQSRQYHDATHEWRSLVGLLRAIARTTTTARSEHTTRHGKDLRCVNSLGLFVLSVANGATKRAWRL